MSLYLENGYFDVEGALDRAFIFNFVIGGRATGKTFGILKYTLEHNLKFMFIRRTQSQVDILVKPEFNIFRPVDPSVEVKSGSKYHGVFTSGDEVIGYVAALSTFSKIRGFDGSDIDIIIFDEFIPELHEHPLREEAAALFNAYETINRNRELQGKRPVILFCAANSNRIDNPILQGFGLLKPIERMIRKHKAVYEDPERSILCIMLCDSPISEAKQTSVLYTALKGSKFNEMSLENRFSFSSEKVKSCDLKQYRIKFIIGDLGIYQHKADRTFYIRPTTEQCRQVYSDNKDGIRQMRAEHPYIGLAEVHDRIRYENLDCFTRFRQYLT